MFAKHKLIYKHMQILKERCPCYCYKCPVLANRQRKCCPCFLLLDFMKCCKAVFLFITTQKDLAHGTQTMRPWFYLVTLTFLTSTSLLIIDNPVSSPVLKPNRFGHWKFRTAAFLWHWWGNWQCWTPNFWWLSKGYEGLSYKPSKL